MNNCILMVEIVSEPELRYTPDDLALAQMRVQFSGLRAEDPPSSIKAVAWGNLAAEVQERYHLGDRVIIEGRLGMNTIEIEGTKEKRAELTIRKIYHLGAEGVGLPATAEAQFDSPSDGSAKKEAASSRKAPAAETPAPRRAATTSTTKTPAPAAASENYDDIPF